MVAIMRHINHYNYLGPWAFKRSPDGQWLLWVREDPYDGGGYPVTSRMDGAGYHEWNIDPNTAHGHDWIDGHRWFPM